MTRVPVYVALFLLAVASHVVYLLAGYEFVPLVPSLCLGMTGWLMGWILRRVS